MEAAIIFHFAGRGGGTSRLALLDFAQLLNPKWKAPQSQFLEEKDDKKTSMLTETLRSMYNFALGGMWVICWFHIWGGLPFGCKVWPGRLVPRRCTRLIS
jgi:hypothetical protein